MRSRQQSSRNHPELVFDRVVRSGCQRLRGRREITFFAFKRGRYFCADEALPACRWSSACRLVNRASSSLR